MLKNGPPQPRRYVLCGLSNRGIGSYAVPLLGLKQYPERGDFSAHGQLVGVYDLDRQRAESFVRLIGKDLPVFGPGGFDQMIDRTRPDVVVVATPDGTHAEYIVAALERGVDVLTEKPIVTDTRQARQVLDAEAASSASIRVAHNYRYSPLNAAIKQMIVEGKVGRIANINFEFNIDTYHGSSYFWRWNRDRALSGGLSITKGCHHFDLLNWWLDDLPQTVFAFGARRYYGPDSPFKPAAPDDRRLDADEQKRLCPYRRQWFGPGKLRPEDDHVGRAEDIFKLPYGEQYDNKPPMYIYDEQIDIEDTYSTVIGYRGGASVTYAANFSATWEGYNLSINGTGGRIECRHFTTPSRCPFPVEEHETIYYTPLFGERQTHTLPPPEGGHGGADPLLKADLFIGPSERSRSLNQAATSLEGVYAVAVGEAVWRSAESGEPVRIADLLGAWAEPT